MGLPIENEVIEELSEHDEDERRTQEKFFKKTGQSNMQRRDSNNYGGQSHSTVQNANNSSHENNTTSMVGNSQSRIKVNLSKQEGDDVNMTGMQEEPDSALPQATLMP